MLIVADSSALIALATCQGLDVLLQLYKDVKVPQAVYDEVAGPLKPEALALASFLADCLSPLNLNLSCGAWSPSCSNWWMPAITNITSLCPLLQGRHLGRDHH